jgi:hypothetical protein
MVIGRNRTGGGNWITLELEGTGKSNRDAIGAEATLTAGGKEQRAQVIGGATYCSASDMRLHFDLFGWREPGGSSHVEMAFGPDGNFAQPSGKPAAADNRTSCRSLSHFSRVAGTRTFSSGGLTPTWAFNSRCKSSNSCTPCRKLTAFSIAARASRGSVSSRHRASTK